VARPALIVCSWAVAIAAAACQSAPACYDGEFQACSCGAKSGYQQCLAGQFGACVCDGITPGSGATSTNASASTGAGKTPLYASCTKNEDCESGLCADFPMKGGLHCTKSCQSNMDCPPPSPGCNPKGECRLP
jgi:hypothetical protein